MHVILTTPSLRQFFKDRRGVARSGNFDFWGTVPTNASASFGFLVRLFGAVSRTAYFGSLRFLGCLEDHDHFGLKPSFLPSSPTVPSIFRHPSPRRPSRHTCTSSTPPTSRHAVTQSMSKACGQIWVPGGFPSGFCREGISTHVRAHIHA